MVDLLNDRLADAINLGLMLKQAHWNVRGATFLPLHELFDRLYGEVSGYADELAERCAQLGGMAEGLVRSVAQRSTLPVYPPSVLGADSHVRVVADVIAAFARQVRQAIETAQQAGDADTADLFTEISRGADKALWLVEAHLG
jgi:starvation-inducible DNA-binding protein